MNYRVAKYFNGHLSLRELNEIQAKESVNNFVERLDNAFLALNEISLFNDLSKMPGIEIKEVCKCGKTSKAYFATGIPDCDECEDLFFGIMEKELEKIKPKPDENKTIEVTPLEQAKLKMDKLVKNEEFEKAAELKKEIEKLEKENEKKAGDNR